ncbi:MAG: 1-hydroxycarotenoid 3,4-desaturase CrtD [Pseudomonadota bacterium]
MAHIAIIGAGIGGLTAAMRLAYEGHKVEIFERANQVGGKMRQVASPAGPVDAGPTVLTMRDVFEAAFQAAGTRLSDHITLHAAPVTARHFWRDAPVLDFYADLDRTINAVEEWGGRSAKEDFEAFQSDIALLFRSFEASMMYSDAPSLTQTVLKTLSSGKLLKMLARGQTLESYLNRRFREPRLAQLFGRYATYVGGTPDAVPMVLGLIAKSEANGVWSVEGGMHQLAKTMGAIAIQHGASLHLNTSVERLDAGPKIVLSDGQTLKLDKVLFNGDPAALYHGLLGPGPTRAVDHAAVSPRALSAHVWTFAASPKGRDLSHHNVFFAKTPNSEFRDLASGKTPEDPTLYICAQDRTEGPTTGTERFEIIMNANASADLFQLQKEKSICTEICFQRLRDFGLNFTPKPDVNSLTGPAEFAHLFPGSDGSLYGRSPSGMMAPFQRPTTRSRMTGVYLCGGGVHPGAGIPMASLSGQHAAAAIMKDLISTSRSRRTVTRGGMSTA